MDIRQHCIKGRTAYFAVALVAGMTTSAADALLGRMPQQRYYRIIACNDAAPMAASYSEYFHGYDRTLSVPVQFVIRENGFFLPSGEITSREWIKEHHCFWIWIQSRKLQKNLQEKRNYAYEAVKNININL